ncbi:MAG: hypothetical protein MJB14_13190, partial [Spirochaetes bacterium]|nr:hypothetical protein [Spirochaetota bacterium]
YLEPFYTEYTDYHGKKIPFYLPTSPEFALKEALSAGLEKIFEIAKVYRNQGESSQLHRPEFFMLEWYRAYQSYEKIMEDCHHLLLSLGQQIYQSTTLKYQQYTIDLSKLKKIKLKDLFDNFQINLDYYSTDEFQFCQQVLRALKERESELTKEDLFFKFFLNHIEPELGTTFPVILYDYPLEMTTLSRQCDDNPLYGQRFELYIGGTELANAYGELIDPEDQGNRFAQTIKIRQDLGKSDLAMPERFIKNLEYGLPPCAGIALGLERLFMIFENIDDIEKTNLYPLFS